MTSNAKIKRSHAGFSAYVYSYGPGPGLEKRVLLHRTAETLVVQSGLSGHQLRWSEVDVPNAWYFTTPTRAIEAFIAKAEAALADKTRKKHHADWREALAEARTQLATAAAAEVPTPKRPSRRRA